MSLQFAGVEPLAQTRVVPVIDDSQVGEARRAVTALAAQMALDETQIGRAAIVATELATNMARHGGGGRLLIRALTGPIGLEIIAVDAGPGMSDVPRAMRDGYSTGGTAGKGLGAVERMSDAFDIYTRPGHGTAVLSRMLGARPAAPANAPLELGVVNVAAPGETLCGDGWCWIDGARGPLVIIADGLGHGADAYQASAKAIAETRQHRGISARDLIPILHQALHDTRGAAVGIAELDVAHELLWFAGVGNIACSVADADGTRSLPSMNGTVGREAQRVQEFSTPCPPNATFVIYSDGVTSRWRLDQYPGLRPRHPSLAAALVYRDHLRGRDDATVIVCRMQAAA